MTKHFRSRYPRYPDDSDYQTNAPSYYDDLARKTKLIQLLAEKIIELSKDTELSIQEFADRLADIKEEMKDFFAEWVLDGTLEEIINERVFTEITQGLDNVSTEVQEARINVINETFPTLKERLDHDFTDMTDALDTHKGEVNDELTTLENNMQKKGQNRIYLSDFPKIEGETDDQWIQRALNSLDGSGFGDNYPSKEGTVYLEGREYFLENTIRLSKHQQLKGVGHATVLNMKQSSKTIIALPQVEGENYVYGVVIQDMVLYGNGSNTGIDLYKTTHLTIRNVTIYDVKYGIWANSLWLGEFDRVVVRNYHEVGMGELGFGINGGTSVLYNNCWVKNFRKGYDSASKYTTFNSCACDTFVDYAYWIRQNATLNGCGAEDGQLKSGSFVFGAEHRGLVMNSCEVMDIHYEGTKDEAFLFYFIGGKVTNNSFRVSGSARSANLGIHKLQKDALVNNSQILIPSGFGTMYYFVPNDSSASVVLELYGASMKFIRFNGEKVINE